MNLIIKEYDFMIGGNVVFFSKEFVFLIFVGLFIIIYKNRLEKSCI